MKFRYPVEKKFRLFGGAAIKRSLPPPRARLRGREAGRHVIQGFDVRSVLGKYRRRFVNLPLVAVNFCFQIFDVTLDSDGSADCAALESGLSVFPRLSCLA